MEFLSLVQERLKIKMITELMTSDSFRPILSFKQKRQMIK